MGVAPSDPKALGRGPRSGEQPEAAWRHDAPARPDGPGPDLAARLAPHIAHDLSNVLQSVLGFAEILARRPDLPEDARRRLETVVDQSRRGARTLAFFRGAGLGQEGEAALEMRALVRAASDAVVTPSGPRIVVEGARGGLWVRGDARAIDRALQALLVVFVRAAPLGDEILVTVAHVRQGMPDDPAAGPSRTVATTRAGTSDESPGGAQRESDAVPGELARRGGVAVTIRGRFDDCATDDLTEATRAMAGAGAAVRVRRSEPRVEIVFEDAD